MAKRENQFSPELNVFILFSMFITLLLKPQKRQAWWSYIVLIFNKCSQITNIIDPIDPVNEP